MIQCREFFDKATYTLTYVVWDEDTRDSIVIDPVADYDQAASTVTYQSLNHLNEFLIKEALKPHFILETHAHADHLSGAQALKALYPKARIGIGQHITEVQKLFKSFFDLKELATDGSQFDLLLKEHETLKAGSLSIDTFFTPGHTPACAAYLIANRVFTGDALFMPDSGTGRCDFPGGDAGQLYDSIMQQLYTLPDSTLVCTGHDYQPNGRGIQFQSTIGVEKESNIHINAQTKREDYIAFRQKRDATLGAPKLLLPSVQVNISAGRLPPKHANGMRYLQIPISEVV